MRLPVPWLVGVDGSRSPAAISASTVSATNGSRAESPVASAVQIDAEAEAELSVPGEGIAANNGTSGANNWPLRGEKHTSWQGGVRVAAFVSGGLVPSRFRGTRSDVVSHVADWCARRPRG